MEQLELYRDNDLVDGLRDPAFADIPGSIMGALHTRDAAAFRRACLRTGYEPQGDFERELYEQSCCVFSSRGGIWGGRQRKGADKRGTQIDYGLFSRLIFGKTLDPFNPNAFTSIKADILTRAGYPVLNGHCGEKVITRGAKPSRVGLVFARVYREYSEKRRS